MDIRVLPLNEIKKLKGLKTNGAHFGYTKTHVILYRIGES